MVWIGKNGLLYKIGQRKVIIWEILLFFTARKYSIEYATPTTVQAEMIKKILYVIIDSYYLDLESLNQC